MMSEISIAGRKIGPNYPPYVIAEMSANHNGSIDNAFRIISEAKLAGANAVKIQTYKPDTITINCNLPDFQIKSGLWAGKNLYELYDWAHTPWEWHKPLFDYAKQIGITIFSSPFDCSAVDLLEDLNAPAYKIASFEAIDLPLIKYVAKTGKPMIISTGMCSVAEIEDAIDAARQEGCKNLAILRCVSGYPAPPSDYNLRTIKDMYDRFGLVIGLSDHTLDNTTAVVSVACGAAIIEKHFTLDRKGGGPDDSFSLEPTDLNNLCTSVKVAWDSIGSINYAKKSSELDNVKFRRSLYFIRPMRAGEIITTDSVRSIRQGYGLSPKYFEHVIGKTLKLDVERGTPITWEAFE